MSKKGNVEIERKWLVASTGVMPAEWRSLVTRLNQEGGAIRQGYFYGVSADNTVRIRKIVYGDSIKCFITAKSKDSECNGIVRSEYENEIFEEVFDALWPLTKGMRVQKRRHCIPYVEYMIELDVYEDELAGLVIAEVEFKSEKNAKAFIAPDWFGKEVTTDARYKNHKLAISQTVPEVGVKENSA